MQQLLVPMGAAVVAVLLSRCADRAPAVRAKALSALGHWLQGWVSHPAGLGARELARCLHLASEIRLDEQGSRAAMQGTPGPAVTMVCLTGFVGILLYLPIWIFTPFIFPIFYIFLFVQNSVSFCHTRAQ